MFSNSRIIWQAGWIFWACTALGLAQGTDYQTAVILVQQKQFDQAFPLLQQILKQTPNDIKARNLLGIALSAAGRREEAADQFKQALTQEPQFVPALKNLAINELALGRMEDAKLHFEAALKLAPRDPTCHFGLAEIAFAGRDFKSAVMHYEQSPQSADPRTAIKFATSYLETGQPGKASIVLENIPPDVDAALQFQAGVLFSRLDRFDAAARRFEQARRSYSDQYQVGYNLTLALSKNGDHSAAIRAGEETLAAGFRKAEMYNLLSQAYERGGRTKQAYEALRAAVELDPQDENNYLDLIALCLKHENYDLGLEIAEIGAQRIPASHRLHLHRGVTLVMKGRIEEALKEFQIAEKLPSAGTEQEALPQIAQGLALIQMDRRPEAVALLRRQTERSPNDARLFWLLGEALGRPGGEEETEAVASLEKSIQLNPRLSQAHALLGKILLRRGNADRAIPELEKALELDPDDLTATYQLAQALQRKGQTERAKLLFARVSQAKRNELQLAERSLMRMFKTESPSR